MRAPPKTQSDMASAYGMHTYIHTTSPWYGIKVPKMKVSAGLKKDPSETMVDKCCTLNQRTSIKAGSGQASSSSSREDSGKAGVVDCMTWAAQKNVLNERHLRLQIRCSSGEGQFQWNHLQHSQRTMRRDKFDCVGPGKGSLTQHTHTQERERERGPAC